MTNRKLADIVKDQKPLLLAEHETVQKACCRSCLTSTAVLPLDRNSPRNLAIRGTQRPHRK